MSSEHRFKGLDIKPPGEPKLEVNRERIQFAQLQHGETGSEEITLANAGELPLHAELSSSASWLSVQPSSVTVSRSKPCPVNIVAETANLPAKGDFQATLKIDSNGGEKTIPVKLRVVPAPRSAPQSLVSSATVAAPSSAPAVQPANPSAQIELPGGVARRALSKTERYGQAWQFQQRVEAFLWLGLLLFVVIWFVRGWYLERQAQEHLNRGLRCMSAGQWSRGATELEQVLRMQPRRLSGEQWFQLYKQLGRAYFRLGRWTLAEQAYQAALKVNPSAADCAWGLRRARAALQKGASGRR